MRCEVRDNVLIALRFEIDCVAGLRCARPCCASMQVPEPVKNKTIKIAKTLVRAIWSARKIESTISVRRVRNKFECLERFRIV